MPYDKQAVDALVAQSQAMLAQTQAQGNTPFAGSSYDSNAGADAYAAAHPRNDAQFNTDGYDAPTVENPSYVSRYGGSSPVQPTPPAPSAKEVQAGINARTTNAYGAPTTTTQNTAPATGTGGGGGSDYLSRYQSPAEIEASKYLDTFEQPQTADEIQKQKMSEAQGSIDSVQKYYDSLLADQQKVNESRSRGNNALSVLTGLSGSTEATTSANETNQVNTQANAKVQNERLVALNEIYTNVRSSVQTEIQNQKTNARASAMDILARGKEKRTEATTQIQSLGKFGTTAEGLAKTDPEMYKYLSNSVGGEQNLKALLFESRPKSEVVGTPQLFGNQMFQAYKTADGMIKYEAVPLPEGVNPAGVESIQKTDNGIFIINKDGTWAKVTGSEDTLNRDQLAETIRHNKAGERIAGVKAATSSGSNQFGGAKLTTGQKTDIADMLVLKKQIDALNKLKTPEGEYIGVSGGGLGTLKSFGAKVTGITTPNAQATRNAIGQIKGFIAKMRGGTSFTENEQRLLDTYTPGINDSDTVIQSKLDSLSAYINDKIESTVMVSGGEYVPESPTDTQPQFDGYTLGADGKYYQN